MALLAFATIMAQAAFYAAGAWCLWNWGMDARLARKSFTVIASSPKKAAQPKAKRALKAGA
jgi:hypothetical protein